MTLAFFVKFADEIFVVCFSVVKELIELYSTKTCLDAYTSRACTVKSRNADLAYWTVHRVLPVFTNCVDPYQKCYAQSCPGLAEFEKGVRYIFSRSRCIKINFNICEVSRLNL